MHLRIHPRLLTLLALGALALVVACSSSATPVPHTPTTAPKTATPAPPKTAPTNTPAATVPPKPVATAIPATAVPAATAQPVPPAASPTPGQSGTIDMNKIFPAGAGRDLFLNNCTSCHAFVCATNAQLTADGWGTIRANHLDKVGGMSDADYATLFAYLIANFNDKKPVPVLPPELAGLVCSAQ